MEQERALLVPPYSEVADVLSQALSANFKNVNVSVCDCPDLSQEPWGLAASGLGGESSIADIGGVDNMEYVANTNKFHFDLAEICKSISAENGFVLGAAATKPDCSVSLDNSELMPCVCIGKKNTSKEAYVDKGTGEPKLAAYNSTQVSSLANVLITEGKPGQVIKVEASVRTGELNFVTCLRKALAEHYKDDQVGMGGTFIIHEGSFKSHVMPSFPPRDAPGDPFWLKFYVTPSPVTCLSVFVSNDKHSDSLRLEHTHFWAHDGSTGGHYHHDTTPEVVKYEGYFVLANNLYRVGRAYPPQK